MIGTSVTADEIASARTWYASTEGYRSRNIITLNTWTSGTITLAADFTGLLNDGTALSTVDSVVLTNDADQTTVAATGLARQKGLRNANAVVAAITTASTHTVAWKVTTTDDQQLTLTGKLTVV